MESQGFLDPSDEHRIAALHLVFLPIINRYLMLFTKGHNKAPISMEKNNLQNNFGLKDCISVFNMRTNYVIMSYMCFQYSMMMS